MPHTMFHAGGVVFKPGVWLEAEENWKEILLFFFFIVVDFVIH